MKKLKALIFCLLGIFAFLSAFSQEVQLKVLYGDSSEFISQWSRELEGTYPDTAVVYKELNHSLSELKNSGYLAASIDSLCKGNDTLRAYLYAGRQYHWGEFKFALPDREFPGVIPAPGGAGSNQVLSLKRFNAYKERVVTFLENRGYPFASVQLKDLDQATGDTLGATLRIKPGKRYVVDSVYIKGNDPVSRRFVFPYLNIYPGMVYNEARLRAIPEKIRNSGFLRQIRDFELEFSRGNRVNIYLYLERANNNQAEGVVGLLPEEGKGGLHFTGQVDVRLWNLFRRGEYLQLNWQNPAPKTQELKLEADVPYLFFQMIGLHTSFELLKQDTSYVNRKAQLGIPFHISSHSRIEVYGDFEASSLISPDGSTNGPYRNYNARLYGVRYFYENLDYQLNPSDGMRLDFSMSAGRRREQERQRKLTSVKAGVRASFYQPLYRGWVVHLRNQSRYRQSWSGSDPVAIRPNGLYRFGGFGSLRGFDDNALRASAYSIMSLEVRYLLSQNSNAYLFFDGAWYQRHTPSAKVSDFPFGFGIGGHIDAGMGIFYLSYAVGKQLDNPIDLSSARIHLGYVSKF